MLLLITVFRITVWLGLFQSVSGFHHFLLVPPRHKVLVRENYVPSRLYSSNDEPSEPIVALNVILRIRPEVRDEFLKVILNNQRGTMNKDLEPLAIEYSFGEDADEPNTFHFHEKYIGEEGIAAHNAAPHFLVWEEFAGTDPFTAPPEVYKYVIYEE